MADETEVPQPAPPSFFTCGPHHTCPHKEQCVLAQRCLALDALRPVLYANGNEASIT